ncbi:MAG TPA: hypothetical protein VMA13_12040 [Candidatus Saccharimonadales bacterium]|nr:hypothetical protein [Candidatus Saccharimonadales bacterium]
MNAKTIIAIGVSSLATWTVWSRPSVIIHVGVPAPPPAVIAPAPVVPVAVGVPDFYVWDGTEFVGVVGTQYYYLGPGDVWIACDPVRLARFHKWETSHADWRAHAIINVKYRTDAHGHVVPLRSSQDVGNGQAQTPAHGPGKHKDHDH